jgi:hypothetical protein
VSSGNDPLLAATIDVDLDDLTLQGDNSFRIWLQFETGAHLALDIPPDSEGHQEIVDTVSEVVGVRLRRLGRHGVVITGLTGVDDEESDS